LKRAIAGIDEHYDAVEQKYCNRLDLFTRALNNHLRGTPMAFEGRRLQLLKMFSVAILALKEAEPERDLVTMLSQVVFDVLRYNVLCGTIIDKTAFDAAFKVAFKILSDENSIETMVATEPSLEKQVRLVLRYSNDLQIPTKADVFNRALESSDAAMRLALKALAASGALDSMPSELREMVNRLDIYAGAPEYVVSADDVSKVVNMHGLMSDAFCLSQGDQDAADAMIRRIDELLVLWGVEKKVPVPFIA
jgi:hypothetical protein